MTPRRALFVALLFAVACFTSIGCIAMGDRVIEELFVLVAETGREHVTVVISPNDMVKRKRLPRWAREQPEWVQARYGRIRAALEELPEQ